MTNTREQFQKLLDAFGDAIQRKDYDRVSTTRRIIDHKLDDIFADLRRAKNTPPPRPTPPPPPRSNLPPRYTTPPPMETKKASAPLPPRNVQCPACRGKGILEEPTGFYRCKECNGQGNKIEATQEWMDFVLKKNGLL